MQRYLNEAIESALRRKMLFVSGPRQTGKTTLARAIVKREKGLYLNWDISRDRNRILDESIEGNVSCVVFDEIHKFKRWRNYLKGFFDDRGSKTKILITGSARLDLYRRGGDSLQGRYRHFRLHPLSYAELETKPKKNLLRDLMTLGAFPEPFFGGTEAEARIWSRDYRARLVREDVADLENVQDLALLERMAGVLPSKVGSPLSLNSLREDLDVAHRTVRRWVEILERLYALYRIYPFSSKNELRALKKEPKHYQFDWTLVKDEAARFENLVAGHLLKWVHYRQDTEGVDLELRYFRDTDQREVDFVITEDGKPILLIEVKTEDRAVSSDLVYLKKKFNDAEAWQLSLRGSKDFVHPEGIRVAPAEVFLRTLV